MIEPAGAEVTDSIKGDSLREEAPNDDQQSAKAMSPEHAESASVTSWMCPVCRAPLFLNSQQWQCENKHSYDKSKAGYVNLLLANQKSSQAPGDSKEMVIARREFLELGHYFPLVEKLAHLIKGNCKSGSLHIYDAGCGEGYYLGQLIPLLRQTGHIANAAGHDISRPAIEKASKKYSNASFAIASSFEMPVVAASQNILLQIFAPLKDSEARRILKPNGLWLRVSPGSKHLSKIKNAIYEKPLDHVISDAVPEGFKTVEMTPLKFEFSLAKPEQRKALLTMTPYFWQASESEVAAIVDGDASFQAEFSIAVFRKTAN